MMKDKTLLLVFVFFIFQCRNHFFNDDFLAGCEIDSLHVVCFKNVYVEEGDVMLASFLVSAMKPQGLHVEFFFSCDSFTTSSLTTFFSVSDIPLEKSRVIDDSGDTVRFLLYFKEQFIKEYFPPSQREVLCGSRNELTLIALANIFGKGDVYYYQDGKRLVLPKSKDFKFYIGSYPSSYASEQLHPSGKR